MTEQDPVLRFWQTTRELLQAWASNGQPIDDFDHDAWIKRYESLAQQLNGGDSPVAGASKRRKTSRDVLIRLKRLAESTSSTQEGGLLFTEQDTETLERRLLDIQQQHLDIESKTVSDLANTLSGVQLGNPNPAATASPQEVQGNTGTEVEVASSTVPSSQTPSRGFNPGVLQDFILESLSFKAMAFREQDIEEAHGTSFDWIFKDQADDSHPSFSKWLSTTELGNIYWITGKPGSGKSTLIRYLAGHKRTRRMLHAWAGTSHVELAGFYFWTSGSQEQRSQTGLLRSLLFQLLSTKPELIATALPHLWQKLAAMTSKERVATKIEWSTPDLMAGFSAFLRHGLSDTKLCLFVDGLDEFEGDHEAIIHFFRGLAEGDHGAQIKLCLSSRPWPVFERAFEYAVPNLKLQASNFQDMMRYAIDRLSSNENVRSAMWEEMDLARQLVQTTVEMASGVFLWVRLAVGELIERFDHPGVKVADMRQCVCALPTELDSLFEVLVFDHQSRDKQAETSRLFQLVRAREIVAGFLQDDSAMSLSLWELAFAINGGCDDTDALERAVQQEPDTRASRRCADTRFWALNRSVGLLEVHNRSGRGPRRGGSSVEELAQNRVTYLHRTMKHPLEEPEHHRRLDEWYPGIALALTHARYVERDTQKLQARLVGEVEKTISWYWESRGPERTDHWARNSFGTYEERHGNQLILAHAYLALCARFGLQQYVIDTLDQMALELPKFESPDYDDDDLNAESDDLLIEETPLLHRALEFLCSRQKTIYPLSSLSFVRALLDASEKYASNPKLSGLIGGVNAPPWSSPLLKKKQITTWIMVLRHLRDAKRRGWIERFDVDPSGTERWTAIVECLVQHGGADRHAVVPRDGWDPATSAEKVLGRGGLLDEYADSWVEERLVPLFGNISGTTADAQVGGRPGDKQSRLEHILAAPT
ncbi:hypothetical protein PG991_009611 [Apiospora marii]|uniref:NACHT domain-containing protein n=1 Tax=Apiospora marii TaxID=335849 RepID=A0ABR1RG39_9PEZI